MKFREVERLWSRDFIIWDSISVCHLSLSGSLPKRSSYLSLLNTSGHCRDSCSPVYLTHIQHLQTLKHLFHSCVCFFSLLKYFKERSRHPAILHLHGSLKLLIFSFIPTNGIASIGINYNFIPIWYSDSLVVLKNIFFDLFEVGSEQHP